MKTLKIATIATIITTLLIALCGIATATAETADTYELTAVVTGWERIGDTDLRLIECTTEEGNVWSFFDDEEYWHVGDMVILTMWECTEAEEDDEVMDVVRIGTLTAVGMAHFLP